MITKYLILVFMLLTKINERFTLFQALRYSVFVCLLVPHVNSQMSGQPVTLAAANMSLGLIRYCDTDAPIYDHDDFMNRIVAIIRHRQLDGTGDGIGDGRVYGTGVFISAYHVLSSYRPFSNIIWGISRRFMCLHFYVAKWFKGDQHHGYYLSTTKFECAREVAVQSDLIVIRTTHKIEFVDEPFWGTGSAQNLYYVGPVLTELAGKDDDFGDDLKFGSLGFINDLEISNSSQLHTVELKRLNVVNCDEWIHPESGHYICIENDNDYIGIHSGAFLFSEKKLFGVGNYALKRRGESILVFTDVRPYRELIYLTCTRADYNIKKLWSDPRLFGWPHTG